MCLLVDTIYKIDESLQECSKNIEKSLIFSDLVLLFLNGFCAQFVESKLCVCNSFWVLKYILNAANLSRHQPHLTNARVRPLSSK